jgi:hypothetical protein
MGVHYYCTGDVDLWTIPDCLDTDWLVNELSRSSNQIHYPVASLLPWLKDDANEEAGLFAYLWAGLLPSQKHQGWKINSHPVSLTIMDARLGRIQSQKQTGYRHF